MKVKNSVDNQIGCYVASKNSTQSNPKCQQSHSCKQLNSSTNTPSDSTRKSATSKSKSQSGKSTKSEWQKIWSKKGLDTFQYSWKKDFTCLEYDEWENLMFCKICKGTELLLWENWEFVNRCNNFKVTNTFTVSTWQKKPNTHKMYGSSQSKTGTRKSTTSHFTLRNRDAKQEKMKKKIV